MKSHAKGLHIWIFLILLDNLVGSEEPGHVFLVFISSF